MVPDSNQLAARILLVATTTTQRPGETPQQRLARAIRAKGGRATAKKRWGWDEGNRS